MKIQNINTQYTAGEYSMKYNVADWIFDGIRIAVTALYLVIDYANSTSTSLKSAVDEWL